MSLDKKVFDQINRVERINTVLKKDQQKMSRYLEQEGDGYLVPENENEKTLKVSQDFLSDNLPKYNKDNIFDLSLPYGPYHIDYSHNGNNVLIAGEKGHVSMIEWKEKNLICELKVNEKINNIKFLNGDMFAVAQRKRLYIYDKQGIELHSIDSHQHPKFLEYLPHHFLLASALENNMIKYQDISIGQIVAEIKTRSGDITSMSQNPWNAVILTGHSNGCVNMWTPNYGSEPVVKILAHSNTVNSLAVDLHGHYLVTTGVDSKMRVWDLRNTYSQVFEYFNPLPVNTSSISQKSLLSVSYGNVVEIWKDYAKSKQKEPYMKHHFKNNQTKSTSLKFVPFEDFLGVGTNKGFSQIIVPGAGEANFDSFSNNPYQTKKQKQTSEIKMLLEKIPFNMITLDPTNLNKTDPRSQAIIQKERKEEIKKKAEDMVKNQKKKLKMRLRNKERHEEILKEFNKNQKIRGKLRAIMEIKTEKTNKEKETIKNDVKVLKMLAEDFDPELYIKEQEEADNSSEEIKEEKHSKSKLTGKMNYSNENKINTSDKSNGFNNSIRADINLYLDFFENYNKNDFDICLKILNSILEIEPNNPKVYEMCEMIRSVVDSNDDNESEDDEKFDLNKNMKINQDGEYYYSDGEDDIKSDEEDKV